MERKDGRLHDTCLVCQEPVIYGWASFEGWVHVTERVEGSEYIYRDHFPMPESVEETARENAISDELKWDDLSLMHRNHYRLSAFQELRERIDGRDDEVKAKAYTFRESGPYTVVLETTQDTEVWVPSNPEDDFNPGRVRLGPVFWIFDRGLWRAGADIARDEGLARDINKVFSEAEDLVDERQKEADKDYRAKLEREHVKSGPYDSVVEMIEKPERVYVVAQVGTYPETRDLGAGHPQFFSIESVWLTESAAEQEVERLRKETWEDDPDPDHEHYPLTMSDGDWEARYGFRWIVVSHEFKWQK